MQLKGETFLTSCHRPSEQRAREHRDLCNFWRDNPMKCSAKLQVWCAESPLAPPCVSSPPQAVFFPSRRLAAKTGKSLTPKKRHDSSYLDELGRLSVLYICKRENWESVKKAIILINNTYLKKIKMCRPFNLLILNEQQIIQKWMKNKLPDSCSSTPWKTTCPSPMEHIHTL